jgi:uncharacterized protein YdeI (YjbR/CyaY-like superfamily)
MAKSRENPKVNWYFEKAGQWQDAMEKLRAIVLSTGLTEELKWGVPCYTLDGKNIVLIHGFKNYCALLFMKGALLKDPEGILIQQTENVQEGRQIRFTHVDEIFELRSALKGYIKQAIGVEKAGLKVPLKKTSEFKMPDELVNKLEDPKFKKAFEALTPGRQRGYILYFSQPKQSATRAARIEKSIPQIRAGKGWNEEYLEKVKQVQKKKTKA